jgi:EAL domain-containing protein (putative c-di-GMP-specific phosphodiesterase class I)
MSERGENFEIVRAIVTLAKNLDMDIVAEGVETEEQRTRLRALGCEHAQGYLFSRPVDEQAAWAMIEPSS